MSYYNDVYLKRLNRYGNDYQTRLQNQREKVFEDLLTKSIYRVDFEYKGKLEPGLLERYQQDDTKTIQYLLTRVSLNIPHGTILAIPDKDNQVQYWMIYYLESIQTSGYNRYFVLHMSHNIIWYKDNNFQSTPINSYAYFFGPHNAGIRDSFKNLPVIYEENNSNYFLILPTLATLKKDCYLEMTIEDHNSTLITEHYRILGMDRISNPGVNYVTLDPIYEYDKTPKPEKPVNPTKKDDEDFYWLTGGSDNGST